MRNNLTGCSNKEEEKKKESIVQYMERRRKDGQVGVVITFQ